jgi:hypothetical protein
MSDGMEFVDDLGRESKLLIEGDSVVLRTYQDAQAALSEFKEAFRRELIQREALALRVAELELKISKLTTADIATVRRIAVKGIELAGHHYNCPAYQYRAKGDERPPGDCDRAICSYNTDMTAVLG